MSPTETTKTVPLEARKIWLRRLAPVVVLCGGLAAAVFAGSHSPQPAATALRAAAPKSGVSAVPARSAALRPAVEKSLTSQYQRSQFSDVMVRHVPDATASSSAPNARWRLAPGVTTRPPSTTSGYGAPVPSTVKAITLPNGQGVSRRIPESSFPAERARVQSGHVVMAHSSTDESAPADTGR